MSALTDTLTNAAGSAVGIVKKAMLILHKDTSAGTPLSSLSSKTNAALGKASGMKSVASALSAAGMGNSTHVLEVQYNPSSITLQANADPTPFQYLQQNFDSSIPTQNMRPPSVVLSVDLVFDDMNPKDAFMIDKFRLSVGDAVSAVSGLAKAAMGKNYSVQTQTNGLIAALIKDSTRYVTFRWAEMAFTGKLTEASANYTMFSVSGRPVRSTVHLNITQEVEERADIGYWNTAFTKAFGAADQALQTGGRSFASRYGNLFNIDF